MSTHHANTLCKQTERGKYVELKLFLMGVVKINGEGKIKLFLPTRGFITVGKKSNALRKLYKANKTLQKPMQNGRHVDG